MKVKVIKAFFDRNTGEPYNAGETYDSTDKKRIADLQKNSYLDASNIKKETAKDESGEGNQGNNGSDTSGDEKGKEGKGGNTEGNQGNNPPGPTDTDK